MMPRSQRGTWRHFRIRLAERYGIQMSYEEWLDLRKQTQANHTRHFVGRTSNTKTWWLLAYKKGKILALYDSKTKGFLSCLPLTKLDKALLGSQTHRKYLGMSADSILLRDYEQDRKARDLA